MVKLAIEGMEFHAFHGFYKEEQLAGGKYTADVYIDLPSDRPGLSDDLDKTVNYEDIYRITSEVMAVPSKLIEHVAQNILDRVKRELNIPSAVTVRVRKHRPPLKGVVDQAWVEVSG